MSHDPFDSAAFLADFLTEAYEHLATLDQVLLEVERLVGEGAPVGAGNCCCGRPTEALADGAGRKLPRSAAPWGGRPNIGSPSVHSGTQRGLPSPVSLV